jgi:hypothetical protein
VTLTLNNVLVAAPRSLKGAVAVVAYPLPHERSGGFDKGRRPVRWSRVGLASRLPAMPDEGRREGSLVKSAAAWTTSPGSAAPGFAFRASRPALEASRAGAERELGWAGRVGGASGPSGPP